MMIDVLEIADFIDSATRERLRVELERASNAAATVLGYQPGAAVDLRVRKTSRLALPAEIVEQVRRLIMERKNEFEDHFGVSLTGAEPPQFLRYNIGDYFVPHQDGNTPLIRDDTRFRKISIVVFMSTASSEPAADTYGGGSLVLWGSGVHRDERVSFNPGPGTLVAFRSETTHEVTPVTHGERYTIACFLRDDT